MARQARGRRPGQVVHVISRFVNREARMKGDRERREYLGRVGTAWKATDWGILAYALMSTHVHWVFVAGEASLEVFFRSLHVGFAQWVNAQQRRIGPVFASRPKEIYLPASDALRVIAYVHNNPCRAGVVASPCDSSWTSHRAYLGLAATPEWLDVAWGLRLSGCEAPELGEYVESRRSAPRDGFLSGDEFERARRKLRQELGPAIELSPALLQTEGGAAYEMVTRTSPLLHRRWNGSLMEVVERVAGIQGVTVGEMRSRDRRRHVTAARRLAVVSTRCLNRPLAEMATVLGVSAQTASRLCREGTQQPPVLAAAYAIAQECWAKSEEEGRSTITPRENVKSSKEGGYGLSVPEKVKT